MIGSKFRKATKGRFLGFVWLILDPVIISLIYFFVFSVVKSNPNAASILLANFTEFFNLQLLVELAVWMT